jgi:hypothetical protein
MSNLTRKLNRQFRRDVSDDEMRRIARAALHLFADGLPPVPGVDEQERREAVVSLFNRGFLRMVADADRVGFEPCEPKDAPQLRSGFSL